MYNSHNNYKKFSREPDNRDKRDIILYFMRIENKIQFYS